MTYINGTEFKFGTDPECFLFDKKQGRFVTAHGKIPGTKAQPKHIEGTSACMQVDGMAIEFNTPAVSNPLSVSDWIGFSRRGITRYLDRMYDLVFKPTCHFDKEEWDAAPEEAKMLGCDPDFNAWSKDVNPTPNGNRKRFRTGAGHIHIGWTEGQALDDDMFEIGAAVTRELDAVVGVASLLFDADTERRKLYGKAGAFRPKHYGVEYRTLSNAWVGDNKLHRYTLDLITKALTNLMNKNTINSREVRAIINKNKTEEARYWCEHHKIPLPPADCRVD